MAKEEKKYLDFEMLKQAFDEMFNSEEYDYYNAKKMFTYSRGVLMTDDRARDDNNYSMFMKMPTVGYFVIFLPTYEDIEKFVEKNADRIKSDRRLQHAIKYAMDFAKSVAFITYSMSEANGRIKHAVALNSGYFKNHVINKNDDLKTKEYKALENAKLLSGLIYHESFGHGELGHLAKKINIDNNHYLTNILEDLVINSRIEAKMPEATKKLKEIGGVFKDTWLNTPFTQLLFGRIQASLNPEKIFNDKKIIEEIKKSVNIEKNKEIVKKYLNELKDSKFLYNFYNNELEKLKKDFIDKTLEKPEEFVDNFTEFVNNSLKYYTETGGKGNIIAMDYILLDWFGRFISEIKKDNPAWEYLNFDDGENEGDALNYVKNLIKEFYTDQLKGKFKWSENENQNNNNQQSDSQGEGEPRPFENGMEEIKPHDDDDIFTVKVDKKTAEQQERRLDQIREEAKEKITGEKNPNKSSIPGSEKGDSVENLESREFNINELRNILNKFMSNNVLPTLERTEKVLYDTIPVVNVNLMIQQIQQGETSIAITFGVAGEKYLEPDTENILFTIFDVSGSMGSNVLSAYKSAVNTAVCDRRDIVAVSIDNDSRYQGLKILNPKSPEFEKQQEEFFKIKGRGGTGNFGDLILTALDKNYEPKHEESKKFRKDFEEKLNKEFDSDKAKELIEKSNNKAFALFTNTDILSTDLFSPEVYKRLEEIGGGKPIVHIFVPKKIYKQIADRVKELKLTSIEVYSVPIDI